MKIQSNTDELIITVNRNEVDIDSVEKLVKTIRYKELVAKSKTSSKQESEIVEIIKKGIGKASRKPAVK